MKNRKNRPVNGKVFRSGVYSTAILAAAILLAVLVNLVVRALPSKYTEFDLSEAKMYTLGDSSVQLAQSLQRDVTIYYLCETGSEDAIILLPLRNSSTAAFPSPHWCTISPLRCCSCSLPCRNWKNAAGTEGRAQQ